MELNVESRDYDFLGMEGEIAAYCNKNQIPTKLTNRLQLAFEECMQLLVSVLDRPRIRTVIEYSEVEEKATMTLRYNGTAYDITREGDPLSVSVLKGIVGGMQYSAASGEYANQVTMEFCL